MPFTPSHVVAVLPRLVPDWLRARSSGRALFLSDRALSLSKGGGRRLARASWSIALGALTHVVWDSFSHPGRWGPRHVARLAEVHGPLAGYQWVQHGRGVLGLVVLVGWLVAWFRRTRTRPLGPEDGLRRWRRRTWWTAGAVVAATVAWTWLRGAVDSGRRLDETTAVSVATRTIEGSLALVVAVAVVSRLWSASSGVRPSRTMGR